MGRTMIMAKLDHSARGSLFHAWSRPKLESAERGTVAPDSEPRTNILRSMLAAAPEAAVFTPPAAAPATASIAVPLCLSVCVRLGRTLCGVGRLVSGSPN